MFSGKTLGALDKVNGEARLPLALSPRNGGRWAFHRRGNKNDN
jgi:hypothetical protein